MCHCICGKRQEPPFTAPAVSTSLFTINNERNINSMRIISSLTKLIVAPVVGITLCCTLLGGCGGKASDDDLKGKTTVTEKNGDEEIQTDTPKIKEDVKRFQATASPTGATASPTVAATSATGSSATATPPAK
jgi:hypothetical protein